MNKEHYGELVDLSQEIYKGSSEKSIFTYRIAYE